MIRISCNQNCRNYRVLLYKMPFKKSISLLLITIDLADSYTNRLNDIIFNQLYPKRYAYTV